MDQLNNVPDRESNGDRVGEIRTEAPWAGAEHTNRSKQTRQIAGSNFEASVLGESCSVEIQASSAFELTELN